MKEVFAYSIQSGTVWKEKTGSYFYEVVGPPVIGNERQFNSGFRVNILDISECGGAVILRNILENIWR